MSKCVLCGSYAINENSYERVKGFLADHCDVHYWMVIAKNALRKSMYLEHYGNKDCTQMAFDAMEEKALET